MTIAAAYLTSEGVVLGTDSTTTVSSSQGVSQLLNHAQKVFEVGEGSRLGICTWGAGKVGNASHRTIAARLAEKIDLSATKVCDAAKALVEVVEEECRDSKAVAGPGGYFLGGWDPVSHIPECHEIIFSPEKGMQQNCLSIGEARFQGCPEFFTRVFYGFDSRLPSNLLANLQDMNLGIDGKQLETAFNKAFEAAAKPLRATGFHDLPIREAMDFVHTYLHVTIKAFKFRYGPPVCGGPIEIAFISTDRKFRWVIHKGFARAIYEQE